MIGRETNILEIDPLNLAYKNFILRGSRMKISTIVNLLAYLFSRTDAFKAYDCAGVYSSKPLRFGQFDLTKILGSCEESLRAQYENITNQRTQVLKFIPNPTIELTNCIVKADLYIGNCGRGFLTTMTHELKTLYKGRGYPLSKADCNRAIKDGVWNLSFHGRNISLNSNGDGTVYPVYLHGMAHDNSGCRGETFVFAEKRHNRGILKVEVTLTSNKLPGRLSSNLSEIYVKDRVRLSAQEGYGYSSKEGTFIWDTTKIPSNTCERFKTVFAGIGDYYKPKNVEETHLKPLLMARSKDQKHSATMKLEYKTSVCGREAYKTNLDNIYVLLHGTFNKHLYTDLDTQTINDEDVDLYENILAIANGNYFTTQIVLDTSFASMSSDICKQEEINALQSLTDWERAGSGLIKPGHVKGLLAKTYGESGVLFICNPVEAKIRKTKECCKELPISIEESPDELFIEPMTHKITGHCTKIPCSDTVKSLWELDGKWFSISSTGEAHLSAPPNVIQLGNSSYMKNVWKHSLDIGIYSKQQLKSLWRSQEIGKAKMASSDQIHRLLKGEWKENELASLTRDIPETMINNIQDQVLSPGMLFLNNGFWLIKIFLSLGLVFASIIALTKCYVRARMLRGVSNGDLNTCSKLSAIFSTVGVMTKKLYSSELQCNCSSEIEALQSDMRYVKIQVDELFCILRNQSQPHTATSMLSPSLSNDQPNMPGDV